MRPDLADILACPADKAPLALAVERSGEDGEALDGALVCASCGAAYPARDGVPNLPPPGYSA